MNNQPPTINTNAVNSAMVANTFGRFIQFSVVSFLAFPAFVLILIGAIIVFSSNATITNPSEGTAKVTAVSRVSSGANNDPATYCSLNYTYVVNDTTYSGATSVSTPENCGVLIGTTISIIYDTKNPTKSSQANTSYSLIGYILLGIGIVLIVSTLLVLVANHRSSKRDDLDGDGLYNDQMPATSAQMTLIQNGMQDLGQFWTPRKLTQAEAREILNEINTRLGRNTSTAPIAPVAQPPISTQPPASSDQTNTPPSVQ